MVNQLIFFVCDGNLECPGSTIRFQLQLLNVLINAALVIAQAGIAAFGVPKVQFSLLDLQQQQR
jgi:hypothetical protein